MSAINHTVLSCSYSILFVLESTITLKLQDSKPYKMIYYVIELCYYMYPM